MPKFLFLHFVQDRVVVVEWQHGLLYWIIIGLVAAGWQEKSPVAQATAASPTSF